MGKASPPRRSRRSRRLVPDAHLASAAASSASLALIAGSSWSAWSAPVVLAVSHRRTNEEVRPVVGDNWVAAYGTYICGEAFNLGNPG
ncbi:MAG: hypothetical protein R2716_13330 [Microthrixaceae bacterium]